MIKRLLISFACIVASISSFAKNPDPTFDFLPNIKTQLFNSSQVAIDQARAIELVKKTLNISANNSYRSVRIRFVYNVQNQIEALQVFLLSSQQKSFEIVKINLTNQFVVTSVQRNYELSRADLLQSPLYAHQIQGTCPDQSVQFVIGNNFQIQGPMEESVENEVQLVYQLAKEKGYNPVLLNINNSEGLQPTVQSYIDWMSCPNVKGFYNEAHGSPSGIMLSDDMFTNEIVDKNLIMKLSHDVVLFDSCSVFNDPLLSSMTNFFKGNAKQYMGGIVPLPFGPSERTASCFWAEAFNQQRLTQDLIKLCAIKNALEPYAYRIKGNGFKYIEKPII